MVEFAIIAVPLLLLFFGIIEVCFIFWAIYDLENATNVAARLIKTGQAQTMTSSTILSNICSNTILLSDCTSKLQLNIQPVATFNAISAPQLVNNGKVVASSSGDPSQVGPSQDVMVTAYYEWPLIVPLTSAALANLSDGNFLIQYAAVFRSEPF